MRVVLIGRFHDLHAVDADPRPHCVLGPSQAEFGHAVQQHVVELAEKETYLLNGSTCEYRSGGSVLNTAGILQMGDIQSEINQKQPELNYIIWQYQYLRDLFMCP